MVTSPLRGQASVAFPAPNVAPAPALAHSPLILKVQPPERYRPSKYVNS